MKKNILLNKPKKSLGQNFLIDENISRKTVKLLDVKPEDYFLEIGPGYGSLTKYLIEQTKNLICVEIDKEIFKNISEKYSDIKIINEDVLKINFNSLAEGIDRLRVVGNIPYNITSQIIFHIIDQREKIKDLTIMVQLEVAERIIAKPKSKEYGILSVISQAYSTPKLLFKVPPQCFFPKPKVYSGMLHFDFTNNLNNKIVNHNLFRKLVRTTFAKRRKILKNSLKDIDEKLDLNAFDMYLSKRPEELSIHEFIDLSNKINTIISDPGSSYDVS